jgi:hypothetical protein
MIRHAALFVAIALTSAIVAVVAAEQVMYWGGRIFAALVVLADQL